MKEIGIDTGLLTRQHQKQSNTINISRKRARKLKDFRSPRAEKQNLPP
jgi:hypothetical protein